MDLIFATGNKGKAAEAAQVLKPLGIKASKTDVGGFEKGETVREIALAKALDAYCVLGAPVAAEDTGFFLKAYPNFPGIRTKFIAQTIGTKGVLKLAEGKRRSAHFECVVGYAYAPGKAVAFEGTQNGSLAREPDGPLDPHLPYDPIFIPAGSRTTYARMGTKAKLLHSARAKAFLKLGKFLLRKRKVII